MASTEHVVSFRPGMHLLHDCTPIHHHTTVTKLRWNDYVDPPRTPPSITVVLPHRGCERYLYSINLPFAQLEYSCDFDMTESRPNQYGGYNYETWQESCGAYVEFEFYDEMDAEEKVRVDANQQFTNLFSSVGSWITSTAIGLVASRAGARVAPGLANSTSGQVTSGVFGSAINDITGWGASAGNW